MTLYSLTVAMLFFLVLDATVRDGRAVGGGGRRGQSIKLWSRVSGGGERSEMVLPGPGWRQPRCRSVWWNKA